jgi:hypothetical protein
MEHIEAQCEHGVALNEACIICDSRPRYGSGHLHFRELMLCHCDQPPTR